jgi:hypothetical protein
MIGGGKWNGQNKVLHGVYINFVSKKSSSKQSTGMNAVIRYVLLADKNGVLLKTSDGFYLTAKE